MEQDPFVVARAPVRVSFGGGGTDLPEYYERHGGMVVSTAITRYCYAVAVRPSKPRITITSADYGLRQVFRGGTTPVVQEPLVLPKAAIEFFAQRGLLESGVDLYLASEVEPGTGLGSSSAMMVAVIRALVGYLRLPMSRRQAAEVACRLEIDRLCMPIGKQDQYASAFGGINAIDFSQRAVGVHPLRLKPQQRKLLDQRLLLFATGKSRNSRDILCEQRKASRSAGTVVESLHRLKNLAKEMTCALEEVDLDGFGQLLNEAWQFKKSISNKISSDQIDAWYTQAREAGATGGKITGAGGGGYLLLYCLEEKQPAVREALAAAGLREMSFHLEPEAARLLTDQDDRHRVSALLGGMGLPDLAKAAPLPVAPEVVPGTRSA